MNYYGRYLQLTQELWLSVQVEYSYSRVQRQHVNLDFWVFFNHQDVEQFATTGSNK